MSDFNQRKYVNQYMKENYDRIIVQVPKGKKAIIDEYRKDKGYKSLNSYINDVIDKDMEQ